MPRFATWLSAELGKLRKVTREVFSTHRGFGGPHFAAWGFWWVTIQLTPTKALDIVTTTVSGGDSIESR